MEDFLLFLMLGVGGSAMPAHIGFHLLAQRHHRDRGWPMPENRSFWGYSWFLMRRRWAPFADRDMRFFAFWGMVSGWIASVALTATAIMIVFRD